MFGFFIFNAIRRVTSEQTAGQVAYFIMGYALAISWRTG